MEYCRFGVVQVLVPFLMSQCLMQYVQKQIMDLQVHVPLVRIALTSTCSCTAGKCIHEEVCTCKGVEQEKTREDEDQYMMW